jgi:predicted acylesterase/phospholipase RssA
MPRQTLRYWNIYKTSRCPPPQLRTTTDPPVKLPQESEFVLTWENIRMPSPEGIIYFFIFLFCNHACFSLSFFLVAERFCERIIAELRVECPGATEELFQVRRIAKGSFKVWIGIILSIATATLLERLHHKIHHHKAKKRNENEKVNFGEPGCKGILSAATVEIPREENETFKHKGKGLMGDSGMRVLCLDGGGVRGLVTLSVLHQMEQELAIQDSTKKLHELFDWIAGTSTGGLIAVSLRMGKSVDEIIKEYKELAAVLFPKNFWATAVSPFRMAVTGGGYSNDRLSQKLKELTRKANSNPGEQQETYLTLGDLHAQYHTGVTTVDLLERKEHADFLLNSRDHGSLPLWKVLLCTTAAPTVFPPVFWGNHQFVDGGLGNNNPTELLSRTITLGDDAVLVSIGTGLYTSPGRKRHVPAPVLLRTLQRAMENETSADNDKNVRERFAKKPGRYFRLQHSLSEKIVLDCTKPKKLEYMENLTWDPKQIQEVVRCLLKGKRPCIGSMLLVFTASF